MQVIKRKMQIIKRKETNRGTIGHFKYKLFNIKLKKVKNKQKFKEMLHL